MTSDNRAHAIDETNLKFRNKFSIQKLSLFPVFEKLFAPKVCINISAQNEEYRV